MEALLQDLRYAARSLRKSPAFTTIAVLTLTLGIGANAGIFSLVDTVLLTPIRYPDPDRLFAFLTTFPLGTFDRGSPVKFNAFREYGTAFEDVSAYRFTAVDITGGEEAEQVPVGQVTAGFFRLFGAAPIVGRTFTADEDRPNGPAVAVLSYGFWQRRFGGDPGIVGRNLLVGGKPHSVVGVLGSAFQMPEVVPAPELWLPFVIAANSTEQAHILWAAGRLRAGHSLAEANEQLRAAAADFRRKYPEMLGKQGSFGV